MAYSDFFTAVAGLFADLFTFFDNAFDSFGSLFVSSTGLTDWGVLTICVFACSVVLYMVNRLISYFVRY